MNIELTGKTPNEVRVVLQMEPRLDQKQTNAMLARVDKFAEKHPDRLLNAKITGPKRPRMVLSLNV